VLKSKENLSQTEELRLVVGMWLRERREAAGLTQADLSRLLNFDYYTVISQLENGRGRIPPHQYRNWARALGVDEKLFVKKMLSCYEPAIHDILFGDEEQAD
jgi:transcriptional regulator with XRE-family HTH domain